MYCFESSTKIVETNDFGFVCVVSIRWVILINHIKDVSREFAFDEVDPVLVVGCVIGASNKSIEKLEELVGW